MPFQKNRLSIETLRNGQISKETWMKKRSLTFQTYFSLEISH